MVASLSIATYASLIACYVRKVASDASKLGSQILPYGLPYPPLAENGGVDPNGLTTTTIARVALAATPLAGTSPIVGVVLALALLLALLLLEVVPIGPHQ